MNRLKIYRACLSVALICTVLLMFFRVRWYLRTQIPDVVRVGVGDEQTLDLGLKEVSVQVVERKRVIREEFPLEFIWRQKASMWWEPARWNRRTD